MNHTNIPQNWIQDYIRDLLTVPPSQCGPNPAYQQRREDALAIYNMVEAWKLQQAQKRVKV